MIRCRVWILIKVYLFIAQYVIFQEIESKSLYSAEWYLNNCYISCYINNILFAGNDILSTTRTKFH